MRRLIHTVLAAATLAVVMAFAAGTAAAQSAQLLRVGDFNSPIYVTAPPDDERRLFVVERGGRIEVMRDGDPLGRSFLKIPGGVSTDGERGLLSMAFAPNYEQSRLFYVFYTTPSGGDLRVDEFKRRKHNRNRADPDSQRRVIRVEHSQFTNHNGGQLQFGPDGHLYISTGDGGGTPQFAQNINVLLGKILRIDPRRDGDQPYRVPSGNPFVGRDGENEIYSYGLRNPHRFSFDRGNGALTIGDVGASEREEVNYRPAGTGNGANFGWDCFEGTLRRSSCNPHDHAPPAFEYTHENGRCSITGGYIARNSSLGSLQGRYIYGDFCTGEIRSVAGDGDRDTGRRVDSLASFGEDARGCIYTASLGGRVSRLVQTQGAGGCAAP